jgi:predicted lipoprotein with Yx(FWY)xxD motif
MGAGVRLSSSASRNRDFALAPMTNGRANATVVLGTSSPSKGAPMMTNRRSNAASPRMQRVGLAATATALATLAALAFLLLHPGASSAAQARGTVVSTASTGLGRILVDSRGHTLYLFGKDRNDKSACAGMCASFWPPLIAAGKPLASAGATASLLGTTRRADGRMQVTYNRHPLYTFVKDTKKGQTNGEGLSAFGAGWNAISPAGTKVERQKPAQTVTPPSNGIPQNNGGDHDSDNNGGPSDGDGNM